MKLVPGSSLVIATHNPGKVKEIGELLEPFGLHVKSAAELNLPEPEETESTFIANARLKARAAAKASGLPALADDSGLCVTALNGAPGIFSARWAGEKKDFGAAMNRVEHELRNKHAQDHSAKFVCALALAFPDGTGNAFESEVHGTLVFPPRGKHGFGYDPIFMMSGMNKTYGEIERKQKDSINHRALAFEKMTKSGVFG